MFKLLIVSVLSLWGAVVAQELDSLNYPEIPAELLYDYDSFPAPVAGGGDYEDVGTSDAYNCSQGYCLATTNDYDISVFRAPLGSSNKPWINFYISVNEKFQTSISTVNTTRFYAETAEMQAEIEAMAMTLLASNTKLQILFYSNKCEYREAVDSYWFCPIRVLSSRK